MNISNERKLIALKPFKISLEFLNNTPITMWTHKIQYYYNIMPRESLWKPKEVPKAI